MKKIFFALMLSLLFNINTFAAETGAIGGPEFPQDQEEGKGNFEDRLNQDLMVGFYTSDYDLIEKALRLRANINFLFDGNLNMLMQKIVNIKDNQLIRIRRRDRKSNFI